MGEADGGVLGLVLVTQESSSLVRVSSHQVELESNVMRAACGPEARTRYVEHLRQDLLTRGLGNVLVLEAKEPEGPGTAALPETDEAESEFLLSLAASYEARARELERENATGLSESLLRRKTRAMDRANALRELVAAEGMEKEKIA